MSQFIANSTPNNSFSNIITTSAPASAQEGKKKRGAPKHFDQILTRARNLYKRSWVDKSAQIKQKSIEKAVAEICTETYTPDVFYIEYARRVDLLLDSRHFCNECRRKGLTPSAAATHIVMLGMKEIESIILHEGYKHLCPFPEWHIMLLADALRPYLEQSVGAEVDEDIDMAAEEIMKEEETA